MNRYRDMWPRKSHTLAPLTKLTYIKRNFKWMEVEQDALAHLKFLSIYIILFKGANVCDRLGHISRQYFIALIKFCNYFREVGGAILVMEYNFLFVGFAPSCVTQKPKYFILVCPKKDFQY